MEKLFHFDSPAEVYKADACVISCFDARFDSAIRKFLKRRGIETYDQIKIPGSAKWLATPVNPTDRDFILGMVRTSMRLHQSPRMLMFAHNDCGAYQGIGIDVVTRELSAAAEILRAAEPSLTIECFFADFDGIYSVGNARLSAGQTF